MLTNKMSSTRQRKNNTWSIQFQVVESVKQICDSQKNSIRGTCTKKGKKTR